MNEPPLDPKEYVNIAATLLNLSLQDEHRQGVIENWDVITENARLVNEFILVKEVESAADFEP